MVKPIANTTHLASSARAWLRAIRGEPVTFVAATAGPADHRHIPGSGCC